MEVVVYANYIGLRRFYRYMVNIGRLSPYEGGQLDRFHCTMYVCVCIYIYIYNKTSIKRNILTIKQNTSGSRSGKGLISTPV